MIEKGNLWFVFDKSEDQRERDKENALEREGIN